MRRLVIVDDSTWIVRRVSTLLQDEYEVYGTNDPAQCLSFVEALQPDVVVVDLMLPGGEMLKKVRLMKLCGSDPAVIATSAYAGDAVMETLDNLGVACLLLKPYLVNSLVERILEVDRGASPKDPEAMARGLLLHLGLRMDLQGFRILVKACAYVMKKPDCSMTKELYMDLAHQLQSTSSQIERACRDCIGKAWQQRDVKLWQRYFGKERVQQKKPVSNGVFLKRIAAALLERVPK